MAKITHKLLTAETRPAPVGGSASHRFVVWLDDTKLVTDHSDPAAPREVPDPTFCREWTWHESAGFGSEQIVRELNAMIADAQFRLAPPMPFKVAGRRLVEN